MSREYKKKDHDDGQAQEEKEGTYRMNLDWLEEIEEMNGLKFIRNGENSAYTNFGSGKNRDGTDCAIPKGLPVAFGDPTFQHRFMSCKYLKEKYPTIKFEGAYRQHLGPEPASDEMIKEVIEKLRGNLKIF